MAKKRNTKRNSKSDQKQSSGIPKWLWMLIGIAVGVVIAYSSSIRDLINKEPAQAQTEVVVSTPKNEPQEPAATPLKKPEVLTLIPPKEPPKYDFYERLPRAEVIIPQRDYQHVQTPKAPLQDKPTVTVTNASSSQDSVGSFLIQVGSFRNPKDAERRKATLILKGMRPHIEAVTTDSGQWHRVRLGPFVSRDKVNQLRSELHSQKIKTLVVNASGQ